MKADLSRRAVLAGAAAVPLAVAGCVGGGQTIPGKLGGADAVRGHALRTGRFPAPSGPDQKAGVVIAGGGVAGLAAGWRLAEAGFTDFVLLELEDRTGGNARSGRNAVSAYPLGAHYLPIPNREASALRHMLARFGVITGEKDGVPVYDPLQVCADLDERVFWQGRWHEGLFPSTGLPPEAVAQHRAFEAAMADFSQATGADGKPAFAIPMALSSSDVQFIALDRTSFAQWLDAQGFTAPPLRDYLRYCCRDDFGTEPEAVSAWAGIHYFAARRGWAADVDGGRELVWPEGNDRLARAMAATMPGKIRAGHSVFRAGVAGEGAVIEALDHATGTSRRWQAGAAILAMPLFVAARVAPGHANADGISYAAWVVANVTVSAPPQGRGVPLAWDNVVAGGESLGYVVATHQSSSAGNGPTVLTWYMALSTEAPAAARKRLLDQPLAAWQAMVRDELVALHPELAGAIQRIDVWRWGHAMARPVSGFLSNPAQAAAREAEPPLLLAHADLSGFSLFEEAHYRGVLAAERAMRYLGHPFESLL